MATGYSLDALNAITIENARPIWLRAILGFNTSRYISKLGGVKVKTKIPRLDGDYDLFQRSNNCTATDKGGVTITQRLFDPQRIEVFMPFCDADLEPFFTFQYLPAGSQIPGTSLDGLLIDHIAKKINKTMEMASWLGVNGGASGIASFNLFDGLLEKIGQAIDDGSIPAAQRLTGAVTAAAIVASIESMVDNLPLDNKSEIMDATAGYKLFLPVDAYWTYNRTYRDNKTALNVNMLPGFNHLRIDGTAIELIPTLGLSTNNGNSQMILSKMDNLWMGYDIEGEETALEWVAGTGSEHKKKWLYSRFKISFQIANPEELVVNGTF